MENMNNIYEKIGKIEATQQMMLDEMRTGFARINGRLDKHDNKIDGLEGWQNTQTGKMAIISIIGGAIFGIVGAFIREKLF